MVIRLVTRTWAARMRELLSLNPHDETKATNQMKTTLRLSALFLACVIFFCGCATPRPPQIEPLLLAKPETPVSLIEAMAELANTDATRLHPNYIWATLKDREQDAGINAAFERTLVKGTSESRLALLRALELKFIRDPKTSALDILGPELSHHFRAFNWQDDDFPGGPEGPNEQFADVMVDVLDLVRPERRANRSRDAVVLRDEATEAVWEYVTNQWVSVPGQERWMLNRHARDSFVRMSEQAKAEGVDLVIVSGHRFPQTAQANAARARNPNAVASFSSHSLGLAIDFQMSHRDDIKFEGLSTRPMSQLVRMRESPVHKWLVLRGEEFDWYPYQNEPWHWEFNPPGLRKIFWADFPGGAPERGIIIEEP